MFTVKQTLFVLCANAVIYAFFHYLFMYLFLSSASHRSLFSAYTLRPQTRSTTLQVVLALLQLCYECCHCIIYKYINVLMCVKDLFFQ